MKAKSAITVLSLALHLCLAQLSRAEDYVWYPLSGNAFDLRYDLAQRSKATGSVDSTQTNPQLGPYFQSKFASDHYSFAYHSNSEKTFRLFVSPQENLNAASQQRSTVFESLRGGFYADISERFKIVSAFTLDEALAHNSAYTGKVWRGLAGDIETGAVTYYTNTFTAMFGRYRSFWGPTRDNLLLSQSAAPMDGFSIRISLGSKITYSYQLGRLDGISPDSESGGDTSGVFVNRFFAAHRIDIRPANNLRIGVFESAIFAGPGRSLELQYLNPFIFFHANQLNEDNNDNTFLGLDFDWRAVKNLNLFGQLLVDDFQIENKTQGDQEPNEVGIIAGAYFANMLGALDNWDVIIRYDNVANRTYNQKLERNRYLNQNQPIGHPYGTDFRNINAEIRRWIGPGYINATVNQLSRGEGRITDDWTEPWLLITGDYSEPSPTGTVEKTLTAQIGFTSLIHRFPGLGISESPRGSIEINVGWRQTENANNVSGADTESALFSAKLSLFFWSDWSFD